MKHIIVNMPDLPNDSIHELVHFRDLTLKDAKTLVELDDGSRLDYYDEVLDHLGCSLRAIAASSMNNTILQAQSARQRKLAKTAANWYATLITLYTMENG